MKSYCSYRPKYHKTVLPEYAKEIVGLFGVKLPVLRGELKEVRLESTGSIGYGITHFYLALYGVRTFSGKDPFRIHIARKEDGKIEVRNSRDGSKLFL